MEGEDPLSPSLKTLLPQRGEQKGVVRKTRPAAKPVGKATTLARPNRLVRWYQETEAELKKVVWPTRKEWANLTIIVVVTTVVVGLFLGFVDLIFERLILLIR